MGENKKQREKLPPSVFINGEDILYGAFIAKPDKTLPKPYLNYGLEVNPNFL